MIDCDRFTVERAAKGEEKAFRQLYDHYAPFVWRIVYRTAGSDKAAAEDIVQDTFIRIFRALKTFNHSSSLGTWIYRIAFNTAASAMAKRLRLKAVTVPFEDERHSSGFRTDSYDTKEAVEKLLAQLPLEDRFLVVAREIDAMTFEEIAAITGKTSESLRTRMSRIKERFAAGAANRSFVKEAVV